LDLDDQLGLEDMHNIHFHSVDGVRRAIGQLANRLVGTVMLH
jgi:hypothetical protein